jgi:ATP-dependent helicase HrpA/adenine-specific DNA-methyltransferase
MSLASARRLRRNTTDVERKLWSRLRDGQLDGYKFHRQHPLGPYILDFFCESERLAVEIDGGQHADDKARDDLRTAWLVARGCRVIRFWNHDVLENIEGVLERLRLEFPAAPHPRTARAPSPCGRGLPRAR